MLKNKKCGFTLIEVVIVLAITAVLAGIAIPLAFKSNSAIDARACQSSRDSLYTTFIMNQKLNGGTKDLVQYLADYEDNLKKGKITKGSEDYVVPCPQGGEFYAEVPLEEQTAVQCTVHTGKANEGWLFDYKEKARELMELRNQPIGTTITIDGRTYTNLDGESIQDNTTGKKYNMNASTNSNMVDMLYAAHGSQWPTLDMPKDAPEGLDKLDKPLALIPYAGQDSTTSYPIVFASPNTATYNGGWMATLVYLPDEKQWYLCPGGATKTSGLWNWSSFTYDEMRKDLVANNWKRITFNPSAPKKA
ncbi:MAG: prepilin-type N-terminal cleavage/methylation domain-containing protein [Ruthenibacterium sp.]